MLVSVQVTALNPIDVDILDILFVESFKHIFHNTTWTYIRNDPHTTKTLMIEPKTYLKKETFFLQIFLARFRGMQPGMPRSKLLRYKYEYHSMMVSSNNRNQSKLQICMKGAFIRDLGREKPAIGCEAYRCSCINFVSVQIRIPDFI